MRFYFVLLLFIICQTGCKTPSLPATPIPATGQASISYNFENEEHKLQLKNYMKAPLRFYVSARDKEIDSQLQYLQPITLQAEEDSLIMIPANGYPHLQPTFKLEYGDPQKPVVHSPVSLPVPRHKPVRILQGYNGTYSHNETDSRYAIDFKLNIGDTVFSASNGFVVQVIEGYKYGGKDLRWKDMGNKIVIYDPETGRFFQYSHLVYNGSIVKQGDRVKQGQPIGLSGNTGYSDTPHLHFVVLVPGYEGAAGLTSVPVDFIEGFKGGELQKKVIIPRE